MAGNQNIFALLAVCNRKNIILETLLILNDDMRYKMGVNGIGLCSTCEQAGICAVLEQ
jgi:hypothetical protein